MDMILSQGRMLLHLLQCFYTITQARVGFFDLTGREVMSYPSALTAYCTLIRSCEKGFSGCMACDRAAYTKATGSAGVHIYRCHAGFIEMIAPMTTTDGERVGYLMIGQVRPLGDLEQNWAQVVPLVKSLPLDLASLKEAFGQVAPMSEAQINACAHILQACAAFVLLEKYIQIQNQPLSKQVEHYIQENLNRPLSLSVLAQEFGVGKTTLCESVQRDLCVTVNSLIRKIRIEKAQQLLRGTTLPVSQVATAVGITDFNYFTKVFKGELGVAPSVFRRLCVAEHLYANKS